MSKKLDGEFERIAAAKLNRAWSLISGTSCGVTRNGGCYPILLLLLFLGTLLLLSTTAAAPFIYTYSNSTTTENAARISGNA